VRAIYCIVKYGCGKWVRFVKIIKIDSRCE
jgi:hypothetical protein